MQPAGGLILYGNKHAGLLIELDMDEKPKSRWLRYLAFQHLVFCLRMMLITKSISRSFSSLTSRFHHLQCILCISRYIKWAVFLGNPIVPGAFPLPALRNNHCKWEMSDLWLQLSLVFGAVSCFLYWSVLIQTLCLQLPANSRCWFHWLTFSLLCLSFIEWNHKARFNAAFDFILSTINYCIVSWQLQPRDFLFIFSFSHGYSNWEFHAVCPTNRTIWQIICKEVVGILLVSFFL